MLSRQRISLSQLPQDEGGLRSDRPAGTRAATTFRKLPSASAGANTKTAAAFTISEHHSPVEASNDDAVRAQTLVASAPSRTTMVTSFTARPPVIVCQVI